MNNSPSKSVLVYSSSKDSRYWYLESYTPAIPQIVKSIFRDELMRASRRIFINSRGGYRYEPSEAYRRMISKTFKPVNNVHIHVNKCKKSIWKEDLVNIKNNLPLSCG